MEKGKRYKAYYSRYGVIGFEKFEELEKATEFLSNQENEGNICGIGVYDQQEKIFYSSDNLDVFGISKEEVLSIKLKDLKNIGIEPLEVKFLEKHSF
jgi:hypothetical protein